MCKYKNILNQESLEYVSKVTQFYRIRLILQAFDLES